MVTACFLLQLEDHEYKPLDPKDIRLPPPMPPSERLLAAVEAFYSPPSHDRPRNRYGAPRRPAKGLATGGDAAVPSRPVLPGLSSPETHSRHTFCPGVV